MFFRVCFAHQEKSQQGMTSVSHKSVTQALHDHYCIIQTYPDKRCREPTNHLPDLAKPPINVRHADNSDDVTSLETELLWVHGHVIPQRLRKRFRYIHVLGRGFECFSILNSLFLSYWPASFGVFAARTRSRFACVKNWRSIFRWSRGCNACTVSWEQSTTFIFYFTRERNTAEGLLAGEKLKWASCVTIPVTSPLRTTRKTEKNALTFLWI